MKKILFGAGKYGRLALAEYKDVEYFCDNNPEKVGSLIEEIPVISFEQLLEIHNDYDIVISTLYKAGVIKQLKDAGITNYTCFYEEFRGYYCTDELVVNPYENGGGYVDQSDEAIELKIQEIADNVATLYGQEKLFNHIEIETINRCNGGCEFCPVSVKNDSREYALMSDELFKKIIDELAEINYSGRLALFSNNEPLLDDAIIERHAYAREKLPNARMHLFSNGTLMTLDIFVELMKYLDELIIDNYSASLELIPNSKAIKEYCEAHSDLKKKVTIVIRNPKEILTNRGGTAPNKQDEIGYPNASCTLPFTQMIIRPDGKVSLCCNDPLGNNTLGDVSKDKIVDVWNNPRFAMVRKCLAENGRQDWNHCKTCDFFSLN